MPYLIYPEESYQIVGLCMEVQNQLGHGFLEAVYKDALEWELREHGIPYAREVQYEIVYKGTVLRHHFCADLVIFDKIIVEVKACKELTNAFIAQTINYLKVSENRLGLLVNFGTEKLEAKRIVL